MIIHFYSINIEILLTIIGIDANNNLFPLAFVIIESECIESWVWFLQTLHDTIPIISARKDLCIIYSRHTRLVRDIGSPTVRRQVGRPCTTRLKNAMDESIISSQCSCSFSNTLGHYRSLCPHNPSRIR